MEFKWTQKHGAQKNKRENDGRLDKMQSNTSTAVLSHLNEQNESIFSWNPFPNTKHYLRYG